MGLRGGGGKKVIKTIVKSKTTEKTVDADRSVYEKAFVNALELHKATHLNFKEMIKSMSLKQLGHAPGRHSSQVVETTDRKVMMIAEFLPIYEPLHVVSMKVNAAMEHMKQLTENSLSEQCADKDGIIKMNLVLEVVKYRIEFKKENEKGDTMAF